MTIITVLHYINMLDHYCAALYKYDDHYCAALYKYDDHYNVTECKCRRKTKSK